MEKYKNNHCFQLSLSIPSPTTQFNPSCHAIFSSLGSALAYTIWPSMGFNIIFPLLNFSFSSWKMAETLFIVILLHTFLRKWLWKCKDIVFSVWNTACCFWPHPASILSWKSEIHYMQELSRSHVLKHSYGWRNRLRSHLECIKHNNTSQHLSSLWIKSEVRLGWEWVGSCILL